MHFDIKKKKTVMKKELCFMEQNQQYCVKDLIKMFVYLLNNVISMIQ